MSSEWWDEILTSRSRLAAGGSPFGARGKSKQKEGKSNGQKKIASSSTSTPSHSRLNRNRNQNHPLSIADTILRAG